MADAAVALTLERIRATSFRGDGGQDYLIQLRASTGSGQRIDAMGRARPRGASTGDRSGVSWEVLTACLGRLEGRHLRAEDPPSAATTVRTLMAEFQEIATDRARVLAETDRLERAECWC